jgi:penicillin-binding protein A
VNRSIRRVALAVMALLVALAGQLTYLQVVQADRLANDRRNVRRQVLDYARPRGEIVTSDGKVVARSVASHDELKYQRLYPLGSLFAPVSGYQSFLVGKTGAESSYDAALTGRGAHLRLKDLGDLIIGKKTTGRLVLTLSATAQLAARNALGDQPGTVVALDPRTGAILAMYSNPTFDPQPLASHQAAVVQQAANQVNAKPAEPALPRAYAQLYAPGSTFKVVTTTVSLDAGIVTPDTQFPRIQFLELPQSTKTIANFGGHTCGGTLAVSFRDSCNTTFAALGLQLGDQFPPGMAGFGISSAPPVDLPGAATSSGPAPGSFGNNKPSFALAGIGQGPVAVTPLEMALVASAVANNGVIMTPHVGAEIRNSDDEVVKRIGPKLWKTAMPPATAATLTSFMVSVVASGTGRAAQIDGVTVAGKTGTAQVPGGAPNAWFISFAPAEAPQFVVAVLVEHGGNLGDEATGGHVAAPIAARMLRTLLGR